MQFRSRQHLSQILPNLRQVRKQLFQGSRLSIQEQKSQQAFAPFLKERDSLGRIISHMKQRSKSKIFDQLKKKLMDYRIMIKQKMIPLIEKRPKRFKLQELSTIIQPQKHEIKPAILKFNKLVKGSPKLIKGRRMTQVFNYELALFYNRSKYQKFFYRCSPSYSMSKDRRFANETEGSQQHQVQRKQFKKPMMKKQKVRITNSLHLKDQLRRRQLQQRLSPKILTGLTEEFRNFGVKIEQLKNMAIQLKNQTVGIKFSI